MWVLTEKARGWEPLPGVPWRDMEDLEFREVARAYAANGYPRMALHNSGFFEHIVGDGDSADEEDTEEEGT